MPGVKCCVVGCRNGYYNQAQFHKDTRHRAQPLFSMYCFPKDPGLRKLWIKRLRLTRDPGKARVCVVHFSDEQFETDMEARIMGIKRARKLKTGALPNRRLRRSKTPENRKTLADGRKSRLEKRSLKKDISNLLTEPSKKKRRRRSNNSFTHSEVEQIKTLDDNFSLVINNSYSTELHSQSDNEIEPSDSEIDISDSNSLRFIEPNYEGDCLKALGLIIKDSNSDNINDFLEHSSDLSRSSEYVKQLETVTVKSEVDEMYSSPLSQVNNAKDNSESTDAHDTACSNCDSLRRENQRLKLQLAFFQSKLSHVADIYHQAEEATLNQVKSKFDYELSKCRKANAELVFNNAHYLSVLRSVLSDDEFSNRIPSKDVRQCWSLQEITDAQKLRDLSQEAYLFVKEEMNISLPELSSLNNQGVLAKSENALSTIDKD